MGHCISVFLARKEDVENDLGLRCKELNAGIVAILGWKDDLEKSYLLKGRRVASIETDYFGGWGHQSASVTEDGNKIFEDDSRSDFSKEPINEALRLLGVKKEEGKDEFDTVCLGSYRSNRDFEEDENEGLNLSEEDEDEDEEVWKTSEVVKLINEFYNFSYGGISEGSKNQWLQDRVINKPVL